MENLENVLDEIDKFEKANSCEKFPCILEEYLRLVAKTGDPVFPWCKVKNLIRQKLSIVMNEFFDTLGGEEFETANNPPFAYVPSRNKILHQFDSFTGAPFTIQRICEILVDPTRHYKRTDKFLRGLEKNILIVSHIEPGQNKRAMEQQQQNLVNGVQDSAPIHSKVGSNSEGKATSPVHPSENSSSLEECSEDHVNGTITTNGLAEDSSSSSSSSSSSTSSSPTPDEEQQDLGPSPKRPRLEVSQLDATEQGETSKIENKVCSQDAPCNIEESESIENLSSNVSLPEPPQSNEEASPAFVEDAESRVPKPQEGTPGDIPEDKEPEHQEELMECNFATNKDEETEHVSKMETSDSEEVNTSAAQEEEGDENKDSSFPSLYSEVGSTVNGQRDSWSQAKLNPSAESSPPFNDGSPDSAQDQASDSVLQSYVDSQDDSDSVNSEATAASGEIIADTEQPPEPESLSQENRLNETDGSEADSTSSQNLSSSSSPVSHLNTSSSSNQATLSASSSSSPLISSRSPEERSSPPHSSTCESPLQDANAFASSPDSDSQPETQNLISTSQSDSGSQDECTDPIKAPTSPPEDAESSCSSSNP